MYTFLNLFYPSPQGDMFSDSSLTCEHKKTWDFLFLLKCEVLELPNPSNK